MTGADSLPPLPKQVRVLLDAAADASYDCGKWADDDDAESYREVFDRSKHACGALETMIQKIIGAEQKAFRLAMEAMRYLTAEQIVAATTAAGVEAYIVHRLDSTPTGEGE